MKLISIGDIHCRGVWKEIVEKEGDADRIIFIGDYIDSFTHSDTEMIQNLKNILLYKEANPEKVVLLVGNHDYHYKNFTSSRYSGYRPKIAGMVSAILNDHWHLFQMAYQEGSFLFTHAGVSLPFLKRYKIKPTGDISGALNTLCEIHPEVFDFFDGDNTGYGEHKGQTPIWIRPQSLMLSAVPGFFQIVGHTHQDGIELYDNMAFIDCFDTKNEYLVIENGNPRIELLDN